MEHDIWDRTWKSLHDIFEDFEEFANETWTSSNELFVGFDVCGSFAEMPLEWIVDNVTDIDIMLYLTDVYAVSDANNLKIKTERSLAGRSARLFVDCKDTHVGYALLNMADHSYLMRRRPHMPDKCVDNGPARQIETEILKIFDIRVHLKKNNRYEAIFSSPKIDIVFSLRHPRWPDVALEWIHRSREHGWPSEDLVTEVVEAGCHLVEKPHPENLEVCKMQWRLSFSVAERILLNNASREQLYTYHVMRLIKNQIAKQFTDNKCQTFLSTYHFKTLMLWAFEKEPALFWNPENLETSINILLWRMIGWMEMKLCPSYFIRSNNLIDHVNDTNREVAIIENLRGSITVCQILRQFPRSDDEFLIWSPDFKKFLGLKLLQNHFNVAFSCESREEFHVWDANPIKSQMFEPILKILRIHFNMINEGHIGTPSYFVNYCADEHFMITEIFIVAYNMFQNFSLSFFQDELPDIDFMDRRLVDNFFYPIAQVSPDAVAYILPYYELTHHTLLYGHQKSRNWMDSMVSAYTNLDVCADCNTTINDKQCTAAKLHQHNQMKLVLSNSFLSNCIIQFKIFIRKLFEWSYFAFNQLLSKKLSRVASTQSRNTEIKKVRSMNLSPEMQWFHFLNEAYRANLYYSGLKKYNQASEITRDILTRTDTLLHWTSPFGSGLFLLQICLEWPSIFDANIQVIIGFLNLRQFVLRREVAKLKWIKVCPVLFLHYIHIQSLNRLNRLNFGEICQILAHLEVCLVDRQINKLSLGPLMIVAALHLNKIDLFGLHRIHQSLNQVTMDKLRTTPASNITGFIKLLCYCGDGL